VIEEFLDQKVKYVITDRQSKDLQKDVKKDGKDVNHVHQSVHDVEPPGQKGIELLVSTCFYAFVVICELGELYTLDDKRGKTWQTCFFFVFILSRRWFKHSSFFHLFFHFLSIHSLYFYFLLI
jgi:hypothetical protein